MAKIILLTIWCTLVILAKLFDEETSGIEMLGKMVNTLIWLSFIYWFAV